MFPAFDDFHKGHARLGMGLMGHELEGCSDVHTRPPSGGVLVPGAEWVLGDL